MKTLTSTIVKIIANNVTFNWFKPYKTSDESESIGTGFFIDNEGYIVTCAHVVVDAIKLWITIPSIGKERIDVDIVGVCDQSDLALLKTKTYKPKHFMKLGDSDGIEAGTKVIAIGYPLGQDRLKQTAGIISGRQGSNFQTDSPINPGNSGGPLVNEKFEVIGVNSSKMMFADNIGYAKPIYQFKIIDQLMRDLETKKNKMVYKPGLFANFNNTSEDLIDYYGSVSGCKSGYYIKKIHKKSPLKKANLSDGDIICAFGKKGSIYDVDNYGECNVPWNSEKVHIYDIMQRYTLQDKIIIKYWRKDQKGIQETTVDLGQMELPQIRLYYKNYDTIDYVIFGGMIVMELTGNHLNALFNMELSRKMADHLSLYAHLKNKYEKVLIITQLFPGCHLNKVESLHQGDILTAVNNDKVNTLDEYRKALMKVKEINGKYYIKYETKLNTLAVCNLATLLAEEQFLSENFKYDIDPIFKTFCKKYPHIVKLGKPVKLDIRHKKQMHTGDEFSISGMSRVSPSFKLEDDSPIESDMSIPNDSEIIGSVASDNPFTSEGESDIEPVSDNPTNIDNLKSIGAEIFNQFELFQKGYESDTETKPQVEPKKKGNCKKIKQKEKTESDLDQVKQHIYSQIKKTRRRRRH